MLKDDAVAHQIGQHIDGTWGLYFCQDIPQAWHPMQDCPIHLPIDLLGGNIGDQLMQGTIARPGTRAMADNNQRAPMGPSPSGRCRLRM